MNNNEDDYDYDDENEDDDDDDFMTEWFERMAAYEMIYPNNSSMRLAWNAQNQQFNCIEIEQIKTNGSNL